MKILHTVEFYWPHTGGAEEVVRQISEALAVRGHDVTVATTALADRPSRERGGVRIVEFPLSGSLAGGVRGDVNSYLEFLRKSDCHVMMNYALQQWSADLALLVAAELPYGKVMATCGLSGLYIGQFESYFRYLHFFLRRFDRLVFHSGRYRDAQYAAQNGLDRIEVIPNAVHAKEFAAPPAPGFRSRHGIAEEEFLVLMVGNYTGAKGQEQLINAIDLARIESATVLLVGKNLRDRTRDVAAELKTEIDALSARSHGRKRVICLELDRAETVEAFFAADLFMLLSQIECSPLVLFEAAAADTPFIASDAGNSREIADWTGAGIIAPGKPHESGLMFVDIPATAKLVEKLYADPGLRRSMAESGRRTVLERFTWDRVADQYEALYAQIADMKAMARAS